MTARSEGFEQLADSDTRRRVANIARIGTVLEIDPANNRARVKSGNLQSAWLSVGTGRAGGNRTFDFPDVGEQVLFISPSGDMRQAVIVTAIHSNDSPAPADSEDVYRKVFKDGTTISYDRSASKLTVETAGDIEITNASKITIVSGGDVELTAPNVKITSNVLIDGDLSAINGTMTHRGRNIGYDHTHRDVEPGIGTTGVPTD